MTLLEAQCTSQTSEAKKFLRCLLYERHSLKSVWTLDIHTTSHLNRFSPALHALERIPRKRPNIPLIQTQKLRDFYYIYLPYPAKSYTICNNAEKNLKHLTHTLMRFFSACSFFFRS